MEERVSEKRNTHRRLSREGMIAHNKAGLLMYVLFYALSLPITNYSCGQRRQEKSGFWQKSCLICYVTKAELDDDESAGVLTNVTKFVISQAAYAFATTSVTSAGT